MKLIRSIILDSIRAKWCYDEHVNLLTNNLTYTNFIDSAIEEISSPQQCRDEALKIRQEAYLPEVRNAFLASAFEYCLGVDKNLVTGRPFPRYVIKSSNGGPIILTDRIVDITHRYIKKNVESAFDYARLNIDWAIDNSDKASSDFEDKVDLALTSYVNNSKLIGISSLILSLLPSVFASTGCCSNLGGFAKAAASFVYYSFTIATSLTAFYVSSLSTDSIKDLKLLYS